VLIVLVKVDELDHSSVAPVIGGVPPKPIAAVIVPSPAIPCLDVFKLFCSDQPAPFHNSVFPVEPGGPT